MIAAPMLGAPLCICLAIASSFPYTAGPVLGILLRRFSAVARGADYIFFWDPSLSFVFFFFVVLLLSCFSFPPFLFCSCSYLLLFVMFSPVYFPQQSPSAECLSGG